MLNIMKVPWTLAELLSYFPFREVLLQNSLRVEVSSHVRRELGLIKARIWFQICKLLSDLFGPSYYRLTFRLIDYSIFYFLGLNLSVHSQAELDTSTLFPYSIDLSRSKHDDHHSHKPRQHYINRIVHTIPQNSASASSSSFIFGWFLTVPHILSGSTFFMR